LPFEVPKSWAWCLFGDICDYGNCENEIPQNILGEAWILDLEDIEKDTGRIIDFVTKSNREFHSNKHRFTKGQVLYSNLRPYLNKVLIAPKDGYCTSEIIPLKLESGIANEYIRYLLMSEYFLTYADMCSYGVKMPRLGATNAKKALIPIPPLTEQYRIVATIESEFALIDEIERNKSDLLSVITVTKTKILSLAISGKLVPQDLKDEPANVLLERIRTEREKLSNSRKIKKSTTVPVTRTADNSPYEQLPNGWALVWLGEIAKVIMGQSPDGNSVTENPDGIEFHQGKIFFTERYVAHSGQYAKNANKVAEEDSVLLCVRAPVGVANITKRKIAIGRGLCSITPLCGVSVDFIFHWLTAFQDDFIAQATGSTFTAITTDVVKQQLIPLPPLTEQQRIVAAIEAQFEILNTIIKTLN